MAEDFLKCQETYGCPNQIKLPFEKNEGYSYAPFIELKFILNGELLTVGNNSRPGKGNTAVIKSMQYGASEGMGVSIEIIDEEGGNFTKSFEAINKGLGNIKEDIKNFELDFGWIITKSCGSEKEYGKISVKNYGPESGISILPVRMNVVYEGGYIKYTLEAQDMMSRVWETRQECNIGDQDHKVTLKEAIKILAKTGQSPKFHVDFLKSDYFTEWEFKKDGDPNKKGEGPLDVWATNQQNKLESIRNWIKGYVTKDEKGIVFQHMTKNEYIYHTGRVVDEEAVLILLEDPGPNECQSIITDPCNSGSDFYLGTYIVNGGNKSPVISFNPSVNWTFAPNSCNGGSAVPDSGAAAKEDGKKKCGGNESKEYQTDCAGAMVANVPHPSSEGESNRAADGVDADAAHQKANAFREFFSPIEAELKILGDPSYVFPTTFMTKTISLIVINPYHLRSTNDLGCPDWLAEPVCNSVFSNKNWMIVGVDHQINPGSYVTTLKLKLPAPGWDLPAGSPLGGQQGANTTETKPEPKQCVGA